MRFKYKETELSLIYEDMVKRAKKELEKHNLANTLRIVKNAAVLQYHLNAVLTDGRLVTICMSTSQKILGEYDNYAPDNKCILFYDSFAWDNRGLTQQYLDAILQIPSTRLVFVNENVNSMTSVNILKMLKEYQVDVFELGKDSDDISKAQKLRSIIITYKPSRAFFHLKPQSVVPFIGFGINDSIKKYQINLTDHAFWMGDSHFFDYTVEFREFGCNLSLSRGFKKEQILYLPYYPWPETDEFKGFPVNTDGQKLLFSGGALYKLEGEDDMFFTILKRILDENPNVLFLYAGDGVRTRFNSFISSNSYESRAFLLGNRSDIAEIFKRIDIYLGTYPIGGGLMSQYAAISGKPLLIYKTYGINEVLCKIKHDSIVFDEMDTLIREANRLLSNDDYYKEKSNYYKSMVIDRDEFRALFQTVMEGRTPKGWDERAVQVPNENNITCINKTGYEIDKLIFMYTPIGLRIKVVGNYILSIPYYYNRAIRSFKRRLYK